jgi:hypothetical protein
MRCAPRARASSASQAENRSQSRAASQRKAEKQSGSISADVRPLGKQVEVLVRDPDAGTLAVFELEVEKVPPGLTHVTGWITPIEPNDHWLVFNGFAAGC